MLNNFFLENWLNDVAKSQFGEDVIVNVEHVYNGDHLIQAYDCNGNLSSAVTFDMNGAFLAARKEIS